MNNDSFKRAQEAYDNMLPPEDDTPEIPDQVLQEKLQEWVKDPPNWLWEKLEEACIEEYLTYMRSRGRYP